MSDPSDFAVLKQVAPNVPDLRLQRGGGPHPLDEQFASLALVA